MRVFEPGSSYHLTGHGVDGLRLFGDDVDCQLFVQRLGRVVRDEGWRVYAACLMPTHHHLLLSPARPGVEAAMRRLHSSFAKAFNARHGRRGAVFEGRFRDRAIRDERHLWEAVRYVFHNPVAAGLVERAEDWPWSTYAPALGLARPWPHLGAGPLLRLFGGRDALGSATSSKMSQILLPTEAVNNA